jgi:predicted nucleic acid-binding protein
MLYVDASVIVTAYFRDEPDHDRYRVMLFEEGGPAVVSEVVRAEVASAVWAASRAGRIADGDVVISRFDTDCAEGGPVKLLALRSGPVIDRAVQLIREHRLRSLDAIHLAVALEDARWLAGEEGLVFATCDQAQSRAAIALGLRVV